MCSTKLQRDLKRVNSMLPRVPRIHYSLEFAFGNKPLYLFTFPIQVVKIDSSYLRELLITD